MTQYQKSIDTVVVWYLEATLKFLMLLAALRLLPCCGGDTSFFAHLSLSLAFLGGVRSMCQLPQKICHALGVSAWAYDYELSMWSKVVDLLTTLAAVALAGALSGWFAEPLINPDVIDLLTLI